MKTLLIALLALSLAGNAALLLRHRLSPSAAPDPQPTGGALASATPPISGTVSAGNASTAVAIPGASFWQSTATETEISGLADRLRAAGFPAWAVRAVIRAMIEKQVASTNAYAKLPYWQRRIFGRDAAAARLALERDQQSALEAVLGPEARPSRALEGVERDNRFGNLSNEKADAVTKIERDYTEMALAAQSGRSMTEADLKNDELQRNLVEKEKLADLAAVLSPAELEAYEMRNSSSATRMKLSLLDTPVDETEYAALFRLRKSFDTSHPGYGFAATPEQRELRAAAERALNDQMRAVLGDDRFFKMLLKSDFIYARVADAIAAFPSVTPATTYKVSQLSGELLAATARFERTPPGGTAQPPDMTAYNTRLDALLGPEAAAAYRKDPSGRVFTATFKPTTPKPPTGG